MPKKLFIKPKNQVIPAGKVKTSLFIRESTQNVLNQYEEKTGIRPGALIDLVFSDENALNELVTKHVANMPNVLKS